ncbi:CocE/NonD family hydrolase [Pseudooceanicola sediminis]|mgnify:FL=1|uniref:CocE/NonD family hydrolase n=1 Tax=Pseudooceanicola sediminis TaxID=2211117 RepID=A0A399IYY6_9RHOB|nr:CocE/NonD family hydrolase [Pseudooceanicola sediminis]KAA2316063.1 CocE/NonD family hydrolase [Puniceibacterium sp. HSS470]RII38174.1 CocE/NonD family hydrolase [Pseudooceanicola sediminis]|tara:strand:- start:18178 stop:20166 length:1989 start_codon:yes stop_codon:yes gene_type:complete
MTIRTDFPYQVTETPDLWIPLSDGTRLSARLWAADGVGPVPAVLEFLPYRKRDGTTARDALTHPYLAGHGYACLRVDMRGNGDSDGLMDDEYSPQELSDACEVIAWIAAQDWCSGNVGMMGISWGGFNSLQVAALQPPALKAIITLCSTVDRYADDIHYKGGCLLNENLGWAGTMWSYSSRPPDPAMRADWREQWLERLERQPFLATTWLSHQRRDAYWQHGSVCEDFSAIKAAVMAVGGWGDSYKNAVPQLVEKIDGPVRGIVGPWVHKYPHFAVPEPRIGFLQEALRWWDQHLKGVETGVSDEPAYSAYLMDGVRPATWYAERPGRWVTEASWPAADIETSVLDLSQQGLGKGAGALNLPLASPQHCGAQGGEFCAIWLGPEMPGDQRTDDALSLCFDSDAMAQTDIVGAPVLKLKLTADQTAGQIAVRLNHVHPDGAATRISWGVLNLTHHTSHAEPRPLIPGEEIEIELALDHIAYRLPEGHRLRVAVSSAYWPMIWPSSAATRLTLLEGALTLPVRAAATGDEITFAPAESAAPLEAETLREAAHVRRSETDHQTGAVTLVIEDDFGKSRNGDHGLIAGSVARERWTIHPDDPLSAHGWTHWTQEIERDGTRLRTEAMQEMWSDSGTFYLTGRIEAWQDDVLIYERDIKDEVPRDNL